MGRTKFIFFTAICISFLFWFAFTPPKILPGVKLFFVSPLRGPIEAIDRAVGFFERISRLTARSPWGTEPRREILRLQRENAELKEAVYEKERLKALLGFRDASQGTSIPARVIGRDPDEWSSVIFIDKGKSDGISEDMVVVSGTGLVGRVRDAGPRMSKVLLINDSETRLGALLQDNREQGLLTGTLDGKCKLIYLSLDAGVERGDIVVTSGTGGIYPRGFLIGRVESVEKEPGKLYKSAVVRPATGLTTLEEVLCIK